MREGPQEKQAICVQAKIWIRNEVIGIQRPFGIQYGGTFNMIMVYRDAF